MKHGVWCKFIIADMTACVSLKINVLERLLLDMTVVVRHLSHLNINILVNE